MFPCGCVKRETEGSKVRAQGCGEGEGGGGRQSCARAMFISIEHEPLSVLRDGAALSDITDTVNKVLVPAPHTLTHSSGSVQTSPF